MAQYCDNFRFRDSDNDSFEFWNGLRGPKGDPGAPGAPGSSVELRGPVATVGDLPASAPADELWMVGASSPYTGYFWNGSSWVDLGAILQGPQGEPGEDGDPGVTFTPSVSSAGVISWTNDGGLPNPDSVNIKGPAGDDGVSPEVTVTSITGGHTVTITDADHPSGQSFNVMDGQTGPAGQGVPSGGTTGQVLKKKSNTDYDTEWAAGGGGGVDPYTDPPEDLGNAASAGSVSKYSRGDHVHKKPSPGDIGAIPVPASTPSSGDVLTYDGSAWAGSAPHYIPAGGGNGYVLHKTSNADHSVGWVAMGSSAPPADSGSGGAGSLNSPARSDHYHPTDTTRAAADLGISGASAGNLVKISTVSSGAPATFAPAAAGTDYQAPLTAGTDYQTPLTAGTDYQTPLTAGTDYEVPVKAGTIALSGTWSGSGPYTQTVSVSGATVTAASKIDLQPTATQLGTLISAGVTALVVENNAGSPVVLTAYAFGAAPSAMTVQCTVMEVS